MTKKNIKKSDTVFTTSAYFDKKQIKSLEKELNGKYVLDSQLFNDGRFTEPCYSIFFIPEKNHYVAVFHEMSGNSAVIDKSNIESMAFSGFIDNDTNEMIFSRYRHDYRVLGDLGSPDGISIDGGRDYMRGSGDWSRFVGFVIEHGNIIVHVPTEPVLPATVTVEEPVVSVPQVSETELLYGIFEKFVNTMQDIMKTGSAAIDEVVASTVTSDRLRQINIQVIRMNLAHELFEKFKEDCEIINQLKQKNKEE